MKIRDAEEFDTERFLYKLHLFIPANSIDCIAGGRLNERELREVHQAVRNMEMNWEDLVEGFVQEAIARRHPYNETWEDRVS